MSQTQSASAGLSERQLANMIGEEYVNAEFPSEDSDDVRRAYRDIARVNEVLFSQIPVRVEFVDGDPYDSYKDMRDAVKRDRVLKVFAGGTHLGFMSREENIKGRAVHDWYGHLAHDVDFSVSGEFKKWDAHRHHYPEHCHDVLFAEVVGQLGAAHYLPDGFADDRFVQRQIRAPSRWIQATRRVVM